MLARDEARDERLARRGIEGAGCGTKCSEEIDRPRGLYAGEGERRERGGHHDGCRLRHHHQTTAIECVGGDTAQQREADDGSDANQAHHAERECAPIGGHEQRDVPQDGRLLHHRA